MPTSRPASSRARLLFRFGCVFVLSSATFFAYRMWALGMQDDMMFFIIPLMGHAVVIALFLGYYYYHELRLAEIEKLPVLTDDQFLESCQLPDGMELDNELALEIRNTLEDSLQLPRGVLRGNTDLCRLGFMIFQAWAPTIQSKYDLSFNFIFENSIDVEHVSSLIGHIQQLLQIRKTISSSDALR